MEVEDVLKIRPTRNHLIVKEDPVVRKSQGGVIIGAGQIETEEWLTGVVVAVGPGRTTKKGVTIPICWDPNTRMQGLMVGDRITYHRGRGMNLPGKHVLLREDQIVPALLDDGYLDLRDRDE